MGSEQFDLEPEDIEGLDRLAVYVTRLTAREVGQGTTPTLKNQKIAYLTPRYLLRRRYCWPTMRDKFVTALDARSVSPATVGLNWS